METNESLTARARLHVEKTGNFDAADFAVFIVEINLLYFITLHFIKDDHFPTLDSSPWNDETTNEKDKLFISKVEFSSPGFIELLVQSPQAILALVGLAGLVWKVAKSAQKDKNLKLQETNYELQNIKLSLEIEKLIKDNGYKSLPTFVEILRKEKRITDILSSMERNSVKPSTVIFKNHNVQVADEDNNNQNNKGPEGPSR